MGEDYSYEINREATYLKLLLKGYGHKEQKIKGYIDETISSLAQIGTDESSLAPYFSAMEELTKQIQIYLKIEWERVKEEVNGETWDNVKERKWEQKLISMYEE